MAERRIRAAPAGVDAAAAARPREDVRPRALLPAVGAYLRDEMNASPHPCTAYATDVRQLADFLAGRGATLPRADVHGVRAFLASLAGAQRKSSVSRKLAALKHFFRYCARTGRRDDDPAATLTGPKRERY